MEPEKEKKMEIKIGRVLPGIDGALICAFCGSVENVCQGYWTHIGQAGDMWQPPACADITACLERQAMILEAKP